MDKTPAELERDRIAAENPHLDETNNDDKSDDKKEETNEEVVEEETADNENGDEENDDETEGDDTDDTDGDKNLDEKDKEIARLKKTNERMAKRIDKVVAERELSKKDLTEARAALEAKSADGETFTKAQVEAEARKIAHDEVAQLEFDKACNRVAAAATKVDKEFKKKVDAMAEDIGPIPGLIIGVLDDLENGGAVLVHLTEDVDEAERIYSLSPSKQSMELTKLSVKLLAKNKKAVSRVPDPNNPLRPGARQAAVALSDTMSTEEWITKRNAERKAAGKR